MRPPSGVKQQARKWVPQRVQLSAISRREAALKNLNAEVVDSFCDSCGSTHTVRQGPKELFLGCRNYKACGASPVFHWKGSQITRAPDGGVLEGGEVVFYRDEFGEPTDSPR